MATRKRSKQHEGWKTCKCLSTKVQKLGSQKIDKNNKSSRIKWYKLDEKQEKTQVEYQH